MMEKTAAKNEKGQVWILSKLEEKEWRVLLLKTLPERGAFWQPVTGTIEPGEQIHKGALREAIEETGLSPLKSIEPLGFEFNFEGKWGPTHETAFFYETYPGCPPATLDQREHQDFQWVTFKDAASLIHYEPNRQAFTLLVRRIERLQIRTAVRRPKDLK